MKVVCAAILENGRLLLAQRKYEGVNGGKWEMPGGKVEKYESLEQAIIRELHEELEMKCDSIIFITTIIHPIENDLVPFSFFLCQNIHWSHKLNDHINFQWILPEHKEWLDICDVDKIFINGYMSEINNQFQL